MAGSNIELITRLSPLQEGLLFHVISGAVEGAYFEQYSAMIDGPVDPDRFASAWSAVVARHPVLRTLFTWQRREHPLQIVRERVTLPWHFEDWQGFDDATRASRWSALVKRDRDRGFDLEQAPLLRVTLVRYAPSRYRVLWSFHHLILDGWSLRIVLNEVRAIYTHGSAAAAGLAEPPAFADYVDWIRSQSTVAATSFWREQLAGFDTPTCIAEGGARRSANSRRAVARRALATAATARVREDARREGITLSTVVFAAWGLLTARYCGRNDVAFGTTVSGRTAAPDGADAMVGLLINTLPLRVVLPPGAPRRDWLRELQRRHAALRTWEATPLADVVRVAEVDAGTDLFESIVVFENVPDAPTTVATEAPDWQLSDEQFLEYSHYPLALLVMPGAALEFIVVYDTARYSEDFIERLLGHVTTAVAALVRPDVATLDDVTFMPQVELAALQERASGAAAPACEDVADALIRYMRECPDQQALVTADATLTYAKFGAAVRRQSAALIETGIGSGTCVPIVAGRTLQAVIAVHAVLAAGAAYALIDSQFPPERISGMLHTLRAGDAEHDVQSANVVLVDDTAAITGEPPELQTLALAGLGDAHAEAEPVAVTADALAYVIFTSGSTGRPKGVKVSRGNLAASLAARRAFYPEPPARYLLVSPVATDSAVAGLFWPLCSGGTLVLGAARVEHDIGRLGAALAEHRVSHLLCLPSLYGLLLEYAEPDQLASLGVTIVAGEACAADVVRRHCEQRAQARLYNEYGPAETTVWASAARLADGVAAAAGSVSIGTPVAGARAWILGPDQRPVPAGVAGELYLGGDLVSCGYWQDPAATAARFVMLAPGGTPERLYRTGDLVRWRDDGQLEFCGRADNQLKIRGHRVEPEEIEAALLALPGVQDAVVIAVDAGQPAVDPLAARLLALPAADAAALLDRAEAADVDSVAVAAP